MVRSTVEMSSNSSLVQGLLHKSQDTSETKGFVVWFITLLNSLNMMKLSILGPFRTMDAFYFYSEKLAPWFNLTIEADLAFWDKGFPPSLTPEVGDSMTLIKSCKVNSNGACNPPAQI